MACQGNAIRAKCCLWRATAAQPPPQVVCKDASGPLGVWKNQYGDSCKSYRKARACNISGGYGPGWLTQWGTFADNADPYGVSPASACCACGGGKNTVKHLTLDSVSENEYCPDTFGIEYIFQDVALALSACSKFSNCTGVYSYKCANKNYQLCVGAYTHSSTKSCVHRRATRPQAAAVATGATNGTSELAHWHLNGCCYGRSQLAFYRRCAIGRCVFNSALSKAGF